MPKSLKQKYLIATQKSIDKYQKLVDKAEKLLKYKSVKVGSTKRGLQTYNIMRSHFDVGGSNCPLCLLSRSSDNKAGLCGPCPVGVKSVHCNKTPWERVTFLFSQGAGSRRGKDYIEKLVFHLKAERDYLKIVKSDIESDKITWKEPTK